MADIPDGRTVEVQGSARAPYVLRNLGGVYSCTCPAWRNQSIAVERRTCKHLRKLRGEEAERQRIGDALPAARPPKEDGDAPGLLLAHTWENDLDLAGWWLSEKLDGVRAYWDGRQFLSRQGNVFHAPDWFVAGLPSSPLDGELWIARKAFQRTVSVVRRQDQSDHWRELRYVVFDLPAAAGTFEERQAELREALLATRCEFALLHEHQLCRGLDHLREELARVNALGGEGLMLRQPGSRYEAGRSSTLLKVKTFVDAEARVLEHLPGSGRHKRRLGALLVELPDGTSFSIGTGFSDAQREAPPAVGSLVTFRYQELSDRGVPRFPSFVRVQSRERERADGPPTTAAASPTARPSATATRPSTAATSASSQRRFELVDGASAKFWEIALSGTDVTVRFGRLGTSGQTQTKSFADPAAAQKHADKLIAEKTGKGYVERGGG